MGLTGRKLLANLLDMTLVLYAGTKNRCALCRMKKNDFLNILQPIGFERFVDFTKRNDV